MASATSASACFKRSTLPTAHRQPAAAFSAARAAKAVARATGCVRTSTSASASLGISKAPASFSTRPRRQALGPSTARDVCVRAESKPGGIFAPILEKYPWVETATYFAVWYYLNVNFNILNKSIYNYFNYPWFVSCIHLIVGLAITCLFWATKIVKFEKPDSSAIWKTITVVAFFHAVGHCLTNVSFASVAVSFTHTVKTLEPVFSSVGSYLVSGTVYPWPIYAALVPIMSGVAICAATELSFTWLGFLTAMSSNVLFAARAIFSKQLMSGMNSINVYNYVSMIALLICLPPTFYFEGATLMSGMSAAAAQVGTNSFYSDLFFVGAYYHLYNQVAYQALGKVDPVTHAVGNVGKRIFVIGFSVLAFGNKLSTQSLIGSAIAIAGAGIYGYLKGVYAEKQKAEA